MLVIHQFFAVSEYYERFKFFLINFFDFIDSSLCVVESFNDKFDSFDDSYTNEELALFLLKEEASYAPGGIDLMKRDGSCYESSNETNETLTYEDVLFIEPSDDEIVRYLNSL